MGFCAVQFSFVLLPISVFIKRPPKKQSYFGPHDSKIMFLGERAEKREHLMKTCDNTTESRWTGSDIFVPSFFTALKTKAQPKADDHIDNNIEIRVQKSG